MSTVCTELSYPVHAVIHIWLGMLLLHTLACSQDSVSTRFMIAHKKKRIHMLHSYMHIDLAVCIGKANYAYVMGHHSPQLKQ